MNKTLQRTDMPTTTANGTSAAKQLNPAFDWRLIARTALLSRRLDEMEEQDLAPRGLVKYQFSARGHELTQLLLSQLLTAPFDAASVYYRCRPFMLGAGLTPLEAPGRFDISQLVLADLRAHARRPTCL